MIYCERLYKFVSKHKLNLLNNRNYLVNDVFNFFKA